MHEQKMSELYEQYKDSLSQGDMGMIDMSIKHFLKDENADIDPAKFRDFIRKKHINNLLDVEAGRYQYLMRW